MTTIGSLTAAARTLDTLLCPHTVVADPASPALVEALVRVAHEIERAPSWCERALACSAALARAAARYPAAWAQAQRVQVVAA